MFPRVFGKCVVACAEETPCPGRTGCFFFLLLFMLLLQSTGTWPPSLLAGPCATGTNYFPDGFPLPPCLVYRLSSSSSASEFLRLYSTPEACNLAFLTRKTVTPCTSAFPFPPAPWRRYIGQGLVQRNTARRTAADPQNRRDWTVELPPARRQSRWREGRSVAWRWWWWRAGCGTVRG